LAGFVSLTEALDLDAYGLEEQALGRYLLPGKSTAVSVSGEMHDGQSRLSPQERGNGETVEVLRMAPEDACSADVRTGLRSDPWSVAGGHGRGSGAITVRLEPRRENHARSGWLSGIHEVKSSDRRKW
jgi:hypothetical protein